MTTHSIVDADGAPLAVGDRLLHIVDEEEWIVYALDRDVGPAPHRVFLCAPADAPKDRRQLMSSVDGAPFRKVQA